MQLLETVFGSGTELGAAQMAVRALAVFVIALVMIRLSGRRSFSQHPPFDACTTVLLGAVLSRAVVGASAWFSFDRFRVTQASASRPRKPAVSSLVGSNCEGLEPALRDEHQAIARRWKSSSASQC